MLAKNPVAVGCSAIVVLLAILVTAGDPGWSKRPVSPAEAVRMLEAVFPGSSFRPLAGGEYADAEGNVFRAQTLKGSFTSAGAREILLIALASPSQASHSQGMYRAKAAVFDMRGRAPVSSVMSFTADEGRFDLFFGKNLDYILFVGSSTFQGLTGWTGGLWRAGWEWTRVWPEDMGFWKDAAVELDQGVLRVLTKKLVQKPGEAAPIYTYEPAYILKWDPEAEAFVKVSDVR